ncbi:RNA 2',3'-cyclic phosphodiesterase [Streptomyces sp. 6N223]|uniref:RNA 2',3'-cyclic phosphodiesterase n=1 Tax=Streptomyces sp. 6N223 TaxID=3457412 RepID=UPI003FD125FD
MRLFAAILPPAAVAEELAGVVRRDLAPLPGAQRLRWTERAGWHITVAYYGETPTEQVPALREALAAVARRRAAFELCLAGGESLSEWALGTGVAGDRAELTALAAEAAGLRPHADQYGTYRPHLTLARNVRGDGDGDSVPFAPYVAALRPFAGRAWRVGGLALMSSEGPTSGRYATAAVLPWAG